MFQKRRGTKDKAILLYYKQNEANYGVDVSMYKNVTVSVVRFPLFKALQSPYLFLRPGNLFWLFSKRVSRSEDNGGALGVGPSLSFFCNVTTYLSVTVVLVEIYLHSLIYLR